MPRKLLGSLVSFLLLGGCANDESAQNPVRLKISRQGDSVAVTVAEVRTVDNPATETYRAYYPKSQRILDSMMEIEVELPPLLDETAYDTATIKAYTRLASTSRGEMKVLVSAELLAQEIPRILCDNARDYSDVLFLIDNSGSMSDDIDVVREGIGQIIRVLEEKKGIRLGIATYSDKQYDRDAWFDFRNFETDYKAARGYVDSIRLVGGGDLPESIYEAFMEVADHDFWRSRSKRIVLVVGDARGKEKADGGEYNLEDVVRKAAENRIRINFFPLIVTPYSERYRAADKDPKPATQTALIEQVYPNPTTGPVNIKMLHDGRYRLGVYTMTGTLVRERYFAGQHWLVDMDQASDGLYVVRASDENNQYDVAKFILRR